MRDVHTFHTLTEKYALVRAHEGVPVIIRSPDGKREPWIFDFRSALYAPEWLATYAELFLERHRESYPFQVCGIETVGIALVAAIVLAAARQGTPVNGFYLRKSRKRIGLMKSIEGTVTDEPIIFVDDLINTARTFEKQLRILAAHGKVPIEAFFVVRFRAPEHYAALSGNTTITSLFTLVDFGLSQKRPLDQSLTFSEQWVFRPPNPKHYRTQEKKSSPILTSNCILVGADDGTFSALKKDTGELLWHFATRGAARGDATATTAAIKDETAIFGSADGSVYALNTKTGKLCWERCEADEIRAAPTISDSLSRVYVGESYGRPRHRGALVALSIQSGTLEWRHDRPQAITSDPLLVDREKLVVACDASGKVFACDAQTGMLRWEYEAGAAVLGGLAYHKKGSLVVFGTNDGSLHAVHARDGSLDWSFRTGGSIVTAPTCSDAHVYVASLDKHLYALDAVTGHKIWEFNTHGRVFATPFFIGKSVLIGSNSGTLYELDALSGNEIGHFQVAERIVGSFAYDAKHNMVFLVTSANEVFCLKRETLQNFSPDKRTPTQTETL